MKNHAKIAPISSIFFALASAVPAGAQEYSERPTKLVTPDQGADYLTSTVDIPMRDGVKLHTVVLIPKGSKDAGILLTRTPHNVELMTKYRASTALGSVIDGYDTAPDVVTEGGCIRVFEDVRS